MSAVVEQSDAASGGLRAGLRRVEGSLRPRLRRFLSWWGNALAAWLPPGTRDLIGLTPQRLLLRVRERDLELALWRGDEPALATSAGRLGDRGDPSRCCRRVPGCRWLLPAAWLRRRLVLPAAAGERLREVLGFEIDRQTPSPPTGALRRVLGNRGDDRIEVELAVVPRTTLEPLAALGPLAPTRGRRCRRRAAAPLVNLMGDARRRRRSLARRNAYAAGRGPGLARPCGRC